MNPGKQDIPDVSATHGRRVLLAEDEVTVAELFETVLRQAGYKVDMHADGAAAAHALDGGGYDVVLSDINLPGLDGLTLLEMVRRRDLDLPVILVTGAPDMTTAIKAVERGATGYITKPVLPQKLLEEVRRALSLRRIAGIRRQALGMKGDAAHQIGDRAGIEVHFETTLQSLYMVFQPIVNWGDRRVIGHEAFVRSTSPMLPDPSSLLDAAERLDRFGDLGRAVRVLCARALAGEGPPGLLFVNLHIRDLMDEALYDRQGPLAPFAERVVLEITERSRLDTVPEIKGRLQQLRDMGFRIALDDLGAGYAGLTSFAVVEPDIVKIDRDLVRNLDREMTRNKLVGSLVQVCADMGLQVVAEGVERPGERDALSELGCPCMQGYLFAHPEPDFSVPVLEGP